MARTISEIYDALITEKETMSELTALEPDPDSSQTLLSDLTTTSKVAIWRLILFVTAVGIYIHEKLFDEYKEDVEAMSDLLIVGTAKWLHSKCLEFQYGYNLEYLNDQYKYNTLDESAQIIKRVAVINVANESKVRIKCAKLVSNVVTPLTVGELSAFNAYVNKIVPVGTFVSVTSSVADDLKVYAEVFFNPLVIAPDGSLLSDSGVFPVEDAINNYISNLPFNGVFNLNALIDAVQAVDGVEDIVLGTVSARYGSLAYSTITQNYTPDAGYLKIASGFDLSSTLTYTANV